MNNARSKMTMRGLQQRDRQVHRDPYNHRRAPDWASFATVPCFVWATGEDEIETVDRAVNEANFKAIVPRGTDITTEDRFEKIIDRQSAVIFEGPLLIDGIEDKLTHFELKLQKVS